jgi:hypothetical protein
LIETVFFNGIAIKFSIFMKEVAKPFSDPSPPFLVMQVGSASANAFQAKSCNIV